MIEYQLCFLCANISNPSFFFGSSSTKVELRFESLLWSTNGFLSDHRLIAFDRIINLHFHVSRLCCRRVTSRSRLFSEHYIEKKVNNAFSIASSCVTVACHIVDLSWWIDIFSISVVLKSFSRGLFFVSHPLFSFLDRKNGL